MLIQRNKPIKIKTITGSRKINYSIPILFSPSQRNARLQYGKNLTVVDCGTFGLKKNRTRIDPIQHYIWYMNFVLHNEGNTRITAFVAPDFDWLSKSEVLMLSQYWKDLKTKAPCLVVPNSAVYSNTINIVGFALKPKMSGPVHKTWTHSFSKYHQQIDGPTELWTYDSLC